MRNIKEIMESSSKKEMDLCERKEVERAYKMGYYLSIIHFS